MRIKHQTGGGVGILCGITLVSYTPVIQHGGYIWDDDDHIVQNELLRSTTGLKRIWTEPR